MAGRQEGAARADEYIVSENDFRTVQQGNAVVGKEILTQFDIVAVVAPDGRIEEEVFSGFPEEFPQGGALGRDIYRVSLVEFLAKAFGAGDLCQQVRVGAGIVQLAAVPFLFFGHGIRQLVSNANIIKNFYLCMVTACTGNDDKYAQTYGGNAQLIKIEGENHTITKKRKDVVARTVAFFKKMSDRL